MENFHINVRKITDRNVLKNLKGGGGGTPGLPIGTRDGDPSLWRSYQCCTDATKLNCSDCITLDFSAHCSGGNVLWNC